MNSREYKQVIEQLLFVYGDPLKIDDIAKVLDIPIKEATVYADELVEEFEFQKRGLVIQKISNHYQIKTRKEYHDIISKLFEKVTMKHLTNSTLETLAIIAYKQPITKSEIESIRGVSVDRIISNLEERKFVRNCGRQESGRKANLYEVTDKFLSYLGIRDIRELPDYDLFKDKIKNMENISTDEN